MTASGVAFQAPSYAMGPFMLGPTTPPPATDEQDFSTLNSMAYDNLNGFLYLNYVPGGAQPQMIVCNQIPIQFTATTSLGSTQVTVSSISGLVAGQVVGSSAGIPPGDTIASVGPGNMISLTEAATGSATGAAMNVVPGVGCDSTNAFTTPLDGGFANGLAVDGAGNIYTTYGTGSGSSYVAQFPPGLTAAGRNYSPASTAFTVGTEANGFPDETGLIGLAADNAGQVFVDAGAEIWIYSPSFNSSNTPTGSFIPVAGTELNGYNGDDGTATLLQLSYSQGVALDPNGALWIADTVNQRIREITPAGFGQGEGTGTVTGSPAFGCLQCGPQSLGNGTGGVAGYGNQPNYTDPIQTNHFSNITLLNPSTHRLYIAYSDALVIFDTSNDTVQTSTMNSTSVVDIIAQQITQMVLDPTTNVIWAINGAGQVLEINAANDAVSSAEIVSTGQYQAQAIAVDTKLNQVYVAYSVTSTNGITVSNYVAVVNGSTGVFSNTLSLNGPAQAMVADSARGVAYLIAQDPYIACPGGEICAQYDYDLVVINGTPANKGIPVEITSTTTLIEGSPYSSGVTPSSLAVDPHTGKVVFADAVDAYFSLYNPAEPSYEATDHVSLGWIPNAVAIDTANSIAYLSDGQYNNVQAIGLAAVLSNTAYGWSYNLFSGTQGGVSCGAFSNAVVPDPTIGQVFITTCTVDTTAQTATPVLNQFQYTGVTANGAVLSPTFTCGYGSATCPPLDTYNLPLGQRESYGYYTYGYALNVDTSDHALFVANEAGLPSQSDLANSAGPDILVFNGPYPPAERPQQVIGYGIFDTPIGSNFNYDFGSVAYGQPNVGILDFTNSGPATMLDPQIQISGANAADFVVSSDGCTSGVAVSTAPCVDAITFTPSILGNETATALVIDDSPDVPQLVTLSGTGVLPTSTGTSQSSTLLQVSALQVTPGSVPTLYATVSPGPSSASGEEVIFLDNSTNPATVLGSGTFYNTAPGGSVWKLSQYSLATGTHPLTAYYGGDTTYEPSTSGTVNVSISSSSGTGPSQPLLSFTPGEFYEAFNNTSGTTNNSDIAIDSAGDDFVLDSGVGSVTEYTVGGGTPISFLAADPYDAGYLMNHPTGVVVAPAGNLAYITDTQNSAIVSVGSGAYFVTPLPLYGIGDCHGGTPYGFASVFNPTGISIGPVNPSQISFNSAGYDLYVADSGNHRVLEINPVGGNTAECGYYPGGVVDAILGGTGSTSGPATLNYPLSVVASGSNVYIADAPPAIKDTSQGNGTIYENGSPITNTNIVFPYSLATDAAGDVYYSDQSLAEVWRIDTQGNFLLVAGDGSNSGGATCTSGAPCQATAVSILTPYGLAVSGNGSIFIGDASGTGQVGEVNVNSGMLTFPSQSLLTTSNPLTVTVTNTASMPLGATNMMITGAAAGDFAIVNSSAQGACNSSTFPLAPGQSCTIQVTFTPEATGTLTAAITMQTQSEIYLGTAQQIQLSGNGAPAGEVTQTINFPPPQRPVVYGSSPDTLAATATSGLPVSYSVVSGPGVITGGNMVSFTGAGTVTIKASQVGGSNGGNTYSAAPDTEQSITVVPAALMVTTPPATRVYEAVNPAFSPQITGFIPPDTQGLVTSGSPSFTVESGTADAPVGTVIPVTTAQGTLALLSPNYAFTFVNSTLTVTCCETQSILTATVPRDLQIPVGIPFPLTVQASSGLPVICTVTSGPGSITGNTLTASGTGTITVQASQPGNSNVSAAAPVTFTVTAYEI